MSCFTRRSSAGSSSSSPSTFRTSRLGEPSNKRLTRWRNARREDVPDIGRPLARHSDGTRPLDRLQADGAEEGEDAAPSCVVPPVDHEHLACVCPSGLVRHSRPFTAVRRCTLGWRRRRRNRRGEKCSARPRSFFFLRQRGDFVLPPARWRRHAPAGKPLAAADSGQRANSPCRHHSARSTDSRRRHSRSFRAGSRQKRTDPPETPVSRS